MVKLGKMLRSVRVGRRESADTRVVQRANRAALADRLPADERLAGLATDAGGGWARPEYGRYMATSPSVYAAIKLRADALTRPPLRVYRVGAPALSRDRRAPRGGGAVASGGAPAGPGEPVAHPRRPVAGDGDPPVPVGRGLLGHRAGRGRPAGAVAAASRPGRRAAGPAALRARVRVPRA